MLLANRPGRLPPLTLALLLLVSCTCGDDSALDGGTDASRGRDTGADVPDVRDANDVRNVSDAADVADVFDSGLFDGGPTAPDWRALPGLPDGCAIDYAEHPERLLDVRWVSCGEGCEYLDPDGSDWEWEVAPVASGSFGSQGYFRVLGTQVVERQSYQVSIFADTSGRVWGAWRGPQGLTERGLCLVASPHSGEGHAAFVISILLDDTLRQERIYHAPLEDLTTALEPIRVLTPETGFPLASAAQPILASSTTVIARVPTQHVYLFQDGELELLGGTPPIDGSPQLLSLVGDHALWSDWRPAVRVAHGRLGEAADVFFSVEDMQIRDFDTDGSNFVWKRCDVDPCESPVELWTAPYVSNPAVLQPRLIRADFPGGGRFKLGGAFYLRRRADYIEAYRLSDGRRLVTRVDPPGFRAFYSDVPVYVTDTEAAYPARIGDARTLIRVQYSAFVEEPLK